MRVWIAFWAALLASLLTAGCNSSATPGVSGGLGAGDGSDTSLLASTGATPDAKDAATSFNPLAPPKTKAPGGREVIKNPTLADILAKGRLPEFTLGKADAPVHRHQVCVVDLSLLPSVPPKGVSAPQTRAD